MLLLARRLVAAPHFRWLSGWPVVSDDVDQYLGFVDVKPDEYHEGTVYAPGATDEEPDVPIRRRRAEADPRHPAGARCPAPPGAVVARSTASR